MRPANVGLTLILVLLFSDVCMAQPQTSALDARLDGIPIDFDQVPLTRVLDHIALRAGNSFVLFGVEVYTEDGQEPLITVHNEGGSTLREALTQVLATLPSYTFEAASPHLINVFPRAALTDTDDLLNLHVPNLSLTNVAPSNVLNNPSRFIPELKAALTKGVLQGCAIGPGLSDKAPGVDLQVSESTVRQVLNLVSEASIAAAQRGAGAAYGWSYLQEEFPSATLPAHVWSVLGIWRGK